MLSVTPIMPVLVLLSAVRVEMQQCMIRNQNELQLSKLKNGNKYAANSKVLGHFHFSQTRFSPDTSLTFP